MSITHKEAKDKILGLLSGFAIRLSDDYTDIEFLEDLKVILIEAGVVAFNANTINKPPIENVICPDCGSEMVSRKGQYGIFWGCVKYPRCKGTRDSEGRSREERKAMREESEADIDRAQGRTSFKKG